MIIEEDKSMQETSSSAEQAAPVGTGETAPRAYPHPGG